VRGHAIAGTGFSSTSLSIFVSRRASDAIPMVLWILAVPKADLRPTLTAVDNPRSQPL
jgi:hypothetical protein